MESLNNTEFERLKLQKSLMAAFYKDLKDSVVRQHQYLEKYKTNNDKYAKEEIAKAISSVTSFLEIEAKLFNMKAMAASESRIIRIKKKSSKTVYEVKDSALKLIESMRIARNYSDLN